VLRSWPCWLVEQKWTKVKWAAKLLMLASWKGESHACPHLLVPDVDTHTISSMLNLMEGIIPEYDRKGKVCVVDYYSLSFSS
jgi:hypothetical protein